ncbi:Calcium-transporting ATPase 1 [bioreactor metagenome]|uniref:Calcium-transporting ATPase 1 n=1 Tax=bioreactor metagenome TaxID=1076179 RepID=A0A645HXG9_9ZZZZ
MQIVLQGIMFAALTLIGFYIGWSKTGDITGGRTMAFFILSLTQVIHAHNMRSTHSLLRIGLWTNGMLIKATEISAAMIALVSFVPPVTSAFSLIALPAELYLYSVALAFVPVPVLELFKFIRRRG